MSVRQSVQALVISALQASDASSSEAALALNSLLEAEKSLLPEIATQLRRSNKITEDVFQLLLSAQQQEEKIGNLLVTSSENNNNNHEECEKIELENREKLTKYFQDKILDLENQNGELHSQIVVTQSQATSVSLEQHARVLAELQESQRQTQHLLDTCNSETNLLSSNQNQQQNASDQDSMTAMTMMMMNQAAVNDNSGPQAGWTKEVWFSAFQQLEENSKKMLSAEESENLRVSLNEWKERASNAINRVGRLETDVNSLRFTNGVLQEQVTSLVVFAEKAVLASSSSSSSTKNNNNSNNSTSLLSIPSEIQKIIHLASSSNNNNNNLRTTNLLTNHAVNAAYRTVELVEDFSSVTVHRNSDSSCTALSANQIPLGAFTFNTVKQLIERFTELSQALYLQELDDVEEKKQMLDRQKRHRSEDDDGDDANVAGKDNEKMKSTTSKVTDTRSAQTDESHLNSSSRHAKNNNQRRSEDAASLDDDDDNEDDSDDSAGSDDLSLQIDADPQIFDALRQITLNLESGFASAAQSESDLNQARLATSKNEIEALSKQLQASRALLKQWQQRCNEAEGREKIAQNLANNLQSELKQQVALELQVPMIKEMPGILTRFEAVLSTIARNADIDKDENTAKVIASDNMKRHVDTMENLFARLQSQYDAFSQLSAIKYGNNNNDSNNNNNNNNNNTKNSNIQQLQNRVNELERELQAQSQDLDIERTRTIEQLERMYQAEEQSRQLRTEMRDLRASALSADQAQVLRDEIDRLENANNQILNGANRIEDELRREIHSLTSARDALQHQVQDGESRAKTFQLEADRARQEVHKSNAGLNAAHDQITKLSRSLQDATSTNNDMCAEIGEFQAQVEALRTALLSEAAVREHFARLFPGDSAGKEALARVAHLDAELKAQFDLNRELAQTHREVTIQLGAVRNQLQESESERVTSRMRAATAEAALKRLQDRAESDAAAAGNELSFLRQDCQRLTSERDAALERSELLVKHVDTLSHDQLSASARLYGLTETRSFNLQMQEMNDRNKTLQSKIDDASAIITEREKEISLVQTSLNEECERAASLASRVSAAKELETMLRENIATFEASLASTVVKLDTTSDSLKQVTQSRIDLSNEIVQLHTKIKTLQDQNGDLDESKKRLENVVGELRKDVADRDELVAVAREAVASGRGSGNASSLTSGIANKSSASTNNSSSSFSNGILGRFTSSIFGGGGGAQ